MPVPLQITFRNVTPSEAVESAIRERFDRLSRFHDHIMSCRVWVESPHRHRHKGQLFEVRVDVTVPGGEILAMRNPDQRAAHEDIYVALRDAFDAVKRQLQDRQRKVRGDVKPHPAPHHARVLRVFPADGFGFLRTLDEREVYFHRNSLVDADFEFLDVGTEVTYVEEQGANGPQAARVMVGKHAY
jgi:ribosomal subunit interface protein